MAYEADAHGATYPVSMARSHFTLAALATSAVDGLDIAGATPIGSPGGDFDAALLTGRDGRHWIVRVPRSESAEAAQSADLVALRALSAGVRARLPFAVTTFAGQAPAGDTRAVVYEFVYGAKAELASLDHDLATSIGEAIAAIHALPTSFVADSGLPSRTGIEAARDAAKLFERAIATRVVPAVLQQSWERAIGDPTLWQFAPAVVNGALEAESFLASDGVVTGLLGWQSLHVGDPAVDLHWLLRAPGDGIAETAFGAYARVRGSVDRQLTERARLLNELELAKWLLHGTATKSTEIVDDAVELMSGLVDTISQNDTASIRRPESTLDVDEVEELLSRTATAR